jgi:hypothetical protein
MARKRSYTIVIDPPFGPIELKCIKSSRDDQIIVNFSEASRSEFHDEPLIRATKELNAVIKNIPKNREHPNWELAFLDTSEGLFLAWTDNSPISAEDDEVIEEALGLKPGS